MLKEKINLKVVSFNSPTLGHLFFPQVLKRINGYMKESRKHKYRVIVGTDSAGNQNGDQVEFISALVVHRIGAGGIYFWQKANSGPFYTLRDRIYEETVLSIDLARALEDEVRKLQMEFGFEIHLDVGEAGDTKDIIKEVVGMVRGNGYEVKTKPQAYGASSVADKHT